MLADLRYIDRNKLTNSKCLKLQNALQKREGGYRITVFTANNSFLNGNTSGTCKAEVSSGIKDV